MEGEADVFCLPAMGKFENGQKSGVVFTSLAHCANGKFAHTYK
jgi:hypothetical protein